MYISKKLSHEEFVQKKKKSKNFSSLKINLMIFRFHLELYTHKLLQKNELKSLYFHILYKNIHKNA